MRLVFVTFESWCRPFTFVRMFLSIMKVRTWQSSQLSCPLLALILHSYCYGLLKVTTLLPVFALLAGIFNFLNLSFVIWLKHCLCDVFWSELRRSSKPDASLTSDVILVQIRRSNTTLKSRRRTPDTQLYETDHVIGLSLGLWVRIK